MLLKKKTKKEKNLVDSGANFTAHCVGWLRCGKPLNKTFRWTQSLALSAKRFFSGFSTSSKVGLLLALSVLITPVQADDSISFESSNTPIGDFVSWFSGHTGQTIVMAKGVTGSVSFSATDLRPNEYAAFFESVLRSHGYQLNQRNGFYTITIDEEEVTELKPSKVKLYRLNHVRNTKLVQLMGSMLAATQEQAVGGQEIKNHDVEILPTTNAIIVTGTDGQIEKIDAIIAGIDKPQRQVFIEAVITETEVGSSEEIGVNLSVQLGNAGFVSNNMGYDKLTDNLLFFEGGDFSAFVKAVSNSTNTKLLSRPNLLIMDREEGYITVGQNVPFLVSREVTDGGKEIQAIERKDVGVSLRVRPHVMGEEVILEIEQQSDSVSNSAVAADIITNTRTLKTVAKVKSRQTITLGGLISTEQRLSESGVPVLMHVPLLGAAFRWDRDVEIKKELSIVIKTTLL
ncbi:secretin N-terminal domain-containing protein [Vibrio nigripulchritudo]|uniref:secretin N-terminal domain-containing protein n=1 Tax=Vibrio nigripulchritudo TaxID=28173 RepID=UPI0009B96988|nr:secretin N-terminal domain-containing protein [Vibrio nigripulchritudo]